ncbi:MAG: prephenate dehydratase [Prevotellaceae bacterium]|jgi:prephenate dehydratase|nr:prephenate dehydratase [Prevotellaceae bacterium]
MDKPKTVAIQGIRGAFHDVAAQKYFGPEVQVVECSTFRELARKAAQGEVDSALMAIENTIAGALLPNYSLIRELGLRVVGEVYLHIRQQLMALPGVPLSEVRYVHSHHIAIEQCREYLDTLPPSITVVEANDTAESARDVARRQLRDTAAIAGRQAAVLYGLRVIAEDIHTCKQNFTRFLALERALRADSCNNKASLCFEVQHRSGALAQVLGMFAELGINLTKIQSVPIIGKPYQYWFYVDVEWREAEAYRSAVQRLEACTVGCCVLGEYAHGAFGGEDELATQSAQTK